VVGTAQVKSVVYRRPELLAWKYSWLLFGLARHRESRVGSHDAIRAELVRAAIERSRENHGVVLGDSLDRIGWIGAETGDETGTEIVHHLIVPRLMRSRQ
jgi:hypothetical protein